MTRKTELSFNLLHVLRNDALGGLEQSTLAVARYLAKQGVRQQVVFLSPLQAGISEAFKADGVPVHALPYGRRNLFSFARDYVRLVRALRPDVQLVSGAFGLHAPLAVLARWARVPDCWTYLVTAPPLSGLSRLAQQCMAHFARPFTRGEIAISNYLAEYFTRHYRLPRSRIRTIYRWRDLNGIHARAENARAARLDTDQLTLCAASRLDWVKDFPLLIRAFARVAAAEPAARLQIAGDGFLRDELESLAISLGVADRVDFLGHRNDIPAILGSCDIFLFATKHEEGLGGVLIEAMAAGTPVVSTDAGPCREVLGDGAAGILTPPGNADAFAQEVLRLWHDPQLRIDIATRAQRFAATNFSPLASGPCLFELLFGQPPHFPDTEP